jgi:hypothetical protein
MGIYVYVPRKRPIQVRLADDKIVDVYPLEYFSKLNDFNRFFDSDSWGYYKEFYKESWKERMQIGAILRAFERTNVEYVYLSSFERPPAPLGGTTVYKITDDVLVPAHVLADDMDSASACYDDQKLFWADCDSLGESQGVLVRPVRVGRKLGPWTVTEETPATEVLNQAECSAENARRKAKREARRCA